MSPDRIYEESPEKFMHQPGELLIIGQATSLVHRLKTVEWGETPAGSSCEEYTADCGRGSQSWGMPTKGLESAVFMSLEAVPKAS